MPAGTHALRATRIGFGTVTQQVTVAAGQTATVELTMSSQALLLEEVVAIGYGTRSSRDVAGAVEGVTAEEFNTGRIVSPEQLIQGKVAGVQVVSSGEPGGGTNIRIRGGASADVILVAAQGDDGLTLFAVEKDSKGLEVEGVRLADSSIGARLTFDDVEVELRHFTPPAGDARPAE